MRRYDSISICTFLYSIYAAGSELTTLAGQPKPYWRYQRYMAERQAFIVYDY